MDIDRNNHMTHHKNHARTCYRCGNAGHFGRDPGCPARGQFCHTCGIEGHFHTRCQTKRKAEGKHETRNHRKPSNGTVNTANLEGEEEEERPEYAFAVGTKRKEKIEVVVGGCMLNMIINSGASTNIDDKQAWEWLKRNKMKCESVGADKRLCMYCTHCTTPLDVIGTFHCETAIGDNNVDAEF